jgi:hypothetical protein
MRKIVINDEHVATSFHKMFGDTGGGIRRDVGKTRRFVTLGHDDDGVIHRALFPQNSHGLRDCGCALTDGAIDAQDVLTALIEDGVDRHGAFPRLSVTQNQLTLTASDGDKRINDFKAGLQRHTNGRAVHYRRRGTFDGQAPAGMHRPVTIKGPTERVDDASQQAVAHGHIHDPAGAFDFVASVQMPVFAQQHHADLFLVHVERDAKHIAWKFHQLINTHARQAGDPGDARGHAGDRAHLLHRQLRRVAFAPLA